MQDAILGTEQVLTYYGMVRYNMWVYSGFLSIFVFVVFCATWLVLSRMSHEKR